MEAESCELALDVQGGYLHTKGHKEKYDTYIKSYNREIIKNEISNNLKTSL